MRRDADMAGFRKAQGLHAEMDKGGVRLFCEKSGKADNAGNVSHLLD